MISNTNVTIAVILEIENKHCLVYCQEDPCENNFRVVKRGLPKSSPLSPILFNINILNVWEETQGK